jgi:UDP-glucose:glycoprotein glucosyltransferase
LFHSPSAQDSLLQKVIKEDKEIPFSSLLYTAIHSENADMRSIQTIIEKELTEAFDEPKLVDQTKYVAPGSPIIEMMAGKDAEGWSRLANALKQDELEPGYTGIVINGRVSVDWNIILSFPLYKCVILTFFFFPSPSR